MAHLERLGARAQNAKTRGQHQAFLRTGYRHIHAPVIKAEIDRAQRRDGVNKQQRRMLGLVQCFANAGDVRGDTGSRLVMAGQHRFDAMLGVGLQNISVLLQRHTGAPLAIHNLHVQP